MYLDSDTLILGDLSEAFELLKWNDLAAHQKSSGYHYQIEGLPDSFPEFNSGVIVFRNNKGFTELMKAWRAGYQRFYKEDGNLWDQKSFRLALWESDLRIGWLRGEYNFMIYHPVVAMTDVKLIHGRPRSRLEAIARQLNAQLGERVHLPGIGVLQHPDREGWIAMIRHIAVMKLHVLKRNVRKFLR